MKTKWKIFDEKYQEAIKKWMKDPTKGIAQYLSEEYGTKPIMD